MFTYIPSAVFEAPPFPEFISMQHIVVVPEVIEAPAQVIARPRRLRKAAILFALIGIILMAISYGPSLIYSLQGSGNLSGLLVSTARGTDLPAEKKYSYQPAFDRNLPETNSISIPTLNIKTTILEATNEEHEDALRKGVLRVNDFGTPYNRESPTILVAHRYGYLSWSVDFRLKHSFYNLPKLASGDTVEVIWRQRKYVYAVYKEEEGESITDYSADLILYTCRDLNSSIRVIKYAKLMEV